MDCSHLGSPDPQGFAIAMHVSEKEGLSLRLFPFAQVPSSSEFNYKIVMLLELLFLLDVEKAREFQKNIYFCFTDYAMAFVWITTNSVKLLNRWAYQATLPDSWETCMQVKKQQLEMDME